jgi:glycosyltransferase involved in cell wall biosynthesis
MPQVRVVIPTFNRAEAVCAALETVERQTFQDYEVIVVDDGSSDDSVARLDRLSRRDPRIRCIVQSHAGAAAARNAAVAVDGNYRYVAFLDADDLWEPNHLAAAVEVLENEPGVALVFGAFEMKDLSDTWTADELKDREARARRPVALSARRFAPNVHILDPERTFNAFVAGTICPIVPTVVIRKSAAGGLPWFDTTLAVMEDATFFLRLSAQRQTWAFVDEKQCVARFLGDNLTRSRDLTSPATLVRQRATLRFARFKLSLCTIPADRRQLRQEIAEAAYLVGQCCAEQQDLPGARSSYVSSLTMSPTYLAAKALVGTFLSKSLITRLKRRRA